MKFILFGLFLQMSIYVHAQTIEERLKKLESLTMSKRQFDRAVDSIATLRLKPIVKETQDWVNGKRFHTRDSVNSIITTLHMPELESAIKNLQNKPDNTPALQEQIDALVRWIYRPLVLPIQTIQK